MAGDVGFSPEDSRVEEVTGIKKVSNDERGSGSRKKQEESHERLKRHPLEYMGTISRAAKESNDQLARKGIPYRFNVYESAGKVMIDLVQLNTEGEIIKEVRRNITDEDFDRVINNIASIEGLMIDRTG
jgi:hypothetical protein